VKFLRIVSSYYKWRNIFRVVEPLKGCWQLICDLYITWYQIFTSWKVLIHVDKEYIFWQMSGLWTKMGSPPPNPSKRTKNKK